MKFIKKTIRKILRLFGKDLESMVEDYLYFRRLKRKPPELIWKVARPGPYARLDAGGARVDDNLYVFGGFAEYGDIFSVVNVFNLKKRKWIKQFDMPKDMAQSHQGMVSDGQRYIYEVSGQLGDQCRPPTRNCFVLDTQTDTFSPLPPLPEARYAATIQLWNGRLHVVGGSKEDRNEPSVDHWSIAVDHGKAVESGWKIEPPIPRGGPHRASAVVDNKFYVFGGQEGDYIAIPGDPKFTCTGGLTNEIVYPDTYMITYGNSNWKRMADMPIKVSHTEFSVVLLGPLVVLLGGMIERKPKSEIVSISNDIQVYDTRTNQWSIAGHLPYRVKSTLAAYHEGWLYMTTGQKELADKGIAGDYDRRTWRAKFSLDL